MGLPQAVFKWGYAPTPGARLQERTTESDLVLGVPKTGDQLRDAPPPNTFAFKAKLRPRCDPLPSEYSIVGEPIDGESWLPR